MEMRDLCRRVCRTRDRSIELRIEELVLEGFDPRDRHRVADSVTLEMACLLAQRGAPAWITETVVMERLDAGALHPKPGAQAETAGVHIARTVLRALASARNEAPRSPGGLAAVSKSLNSVEAD